MRATELSGTNDKEGGERKARGRSEKKKNGFALHFLNKLRASRYKITQLIKKSIDFRDMQENYPVSLSTQIDGISFTWLFVLLPIACAMRNLFKFSGWNLDELMHKLHTIKHVF